MKLHSSVSRWIKVVTAGTVVVTCSSIAFAQEYPSKPLRFIVPFAAGGTTDGISRIVAQRTGELMGQPVVVKNRAGGNAGTDYFPCPMRMAIPFRLSAIVLRLIQRCTVLCPIYRQADLIPVVLLAQAPFVMVTRPNSPFKTFEEMLAFGRANPGKITYASGGNGTIGHLGAHWLADLAKIRMRHIPYKGGAAAMTDLLDGQVDVFFDTLITNPPFLKSGQVRPLFVTTEKRISTYPEVPTIADLGFPDLAFSA